MQYLDIGTPNYAPAPNLSRVFFSNRADADPAPSRGILIPDFFQPGPFERMEDASGHPLAASYPGMENNIVVEIHVRIDLITRSFVLRRVLIHRSGLATCVIPSKSRLLVAAGFSTTSSSVTSRALISRTLSRSM
jgi:hypothetical protein